MSSERNLESGCTGWCDRFFGQREGLDPGPISSQIEPENSDAREIYRLKAKNAKQDKHIQQLNKRVTDLNEREQDLMEKLDMLQGVANGKNWGGEKVMEEMGAEILHLKKRLKRKASKLSRVEKDAKERNERKETSISRLEAKVAELRRFNEDANQEASRKAWSIKKLEERVAELNRQVQETTVAEMRRLLQERTAELSILRAENQRNVSKAKKVDDLEAKMVVLNRALQDKKTRLSDLEVQSQRSTWRARGNEQSDTTAAELNHRLQEEMAKVSKMEEAARRKEKEMRALERKVAEFSQRLQGETEASRWKGKGVERPDQAMEEAVWRKEQETKGLVAKVAELTQRLRGETEASRQKEKETKRLEAKVTELTEASRRKERDIERLEAQKADFERRLHEKEEVARQISRKERDSKRLETKVAELELRLQEKTVKLEESSRRNSRKGESSERLEGKVTELTTKLSRLEDDARRWEQTNRDLSATNQKQRDEINQLKAHVKTAGEPASKAPSQALVRKTDSISAVEVADLVRMLNAQIEQVSTLIADSFSYRESPVSGEESAALNDLRDYLGPWLFNDLSRRSNEPEMENDSLIMQIALQTVLVHACSRIINHWNPPFWDHGSIFFRLYSNMEGVGAGHVIAGTWSAVAHTMSQSKTQQANVKYLSEIVVKLIPAIGGSLPSGKSLPSEYQEKVEDIAKRALELHQIVGKDVTSMDLVTYTIPSDTQFDPSQMDNTEGSADGSGSVPQDRVICTLEMGLQYRKRVELGKPGGDQYGVTLKPKVVLSAALEG